jgi:hypothetical protein
VIRHFYQFGPFRLNVAERVLTRDGVSVPLMPKTVDILRALAAVRDEGACKKRSRQPGVALCRTYDRAGQHSRLGTSSNCLLRDAQYA